MWANNVFHASLTLYKGVLTLMYFNSLGSLVILFQLTLCFVCVSYHLLLYSYTSILDQLRDAVVGFDMCLLSLSRGLVVFMFYAQFGSLGLLSLLTWKNACSGHTHVAEALKVPIHIFFTMPWTWVFHFICYIHSHFFFFIGLFCKVNLNW